MTDTMTERDVQAQPTADEIVEALLDRVRLAERERDEAGAALGAVAAAFDTGAVEDSSLFLVAKFHDAFNVPFLVAPGVPATERAELRLRLLAEEFDELKAGIAACDIVQIADALADLQIVLDGTFLEFGLGRAKHALVAEVHSSNMSKLGGDGLPMLREDGKILKGPGYQPPDVAGVIDAVRAELASETSDDE